MNSNDGVTFPTWDPHLRLDYAFVPKRDANRIAVCEVLWAPEPIVREASDHAPILVEAR